MKTKLRNKELLLISHLRQNSRETMTNISKSTKMPISTIFDKIKKYEKGLIVKHTALLDFVELGYNVRANIMLKVNRKSREEFRDYIKRDQRVNSAYRVNNGFDFIIEVVSKDVRELQDFIESVEEKFEITEREVFYIIDDIKREAFLSNPNVYF
ncbi:Lrp/AsnC family transcriptional regulator [Acidobacteria bacterium AH-259-D05]|nr:Lrp/AsnC family transcriptional regulator [Acidobacteria bacterium AH-259-D05]